MGINVPHELIDELGPGFRRGAITNKHGQIVEVWEYKIKNPSIFSRLAKETALLGAAFGTFVLTMSPDAGGFVYEVGSTSMKSSNQKERNKYWLYFINEQLVCWGKAGDWNEAQNQIPYINFNIKDNLPSPVQ